MSSTLPPCEPAPSAAADRGRALGWLAAAAGASGSPAPAHASDLPAEVEPSAMLSRLVRRTTFGPTPAELTLAATLGFSGYLEQQLAPELIEDSACQSRVHPVMVLPTSPRVLVNTYGPNDLPTFITDSVVLRAVLSRRQLFERVVEFWGDHFNINVNDEQQHVLKVIHDREVIRPNALGTFPDLLRANLQSPSMLNYLDNHVNIAGRPNENLARELMELHTLGPGFPYSQRDVEELARCLTGWSSVPWRDISHPDYGLFVFNADRHDNGEKLFLGQVIGAGGGIQDGFRAIEILAAQPATAQRVADKLTRWFLGESPPKSVVDGATAAYQATGGSIKAMIRAILTPDALFAARPKIKRPLHLVASMIRSLSGTLTATAETRYWVGNAGHLPFNWGPPDGYPDAPTYWGKSVSQRWRLAGMFGDNAIAGLGIDLTSFFADVTTVSAAIARIDSALFQGEMPAPDRESVRTYLSGGQLSSQRLRNALALSIASPGFQWY